MRRIEKIVENLSDYIQGKRVLEIACGDSEFSLNASAYAGKVCATDIALDRFHKRNVNEIPQNLEFKEMDASKLQLEDSSFDIAVCYNAMVHLKEIKESILKEMTRVTIPNGWLLFIATWCMDKSILVELKENIAARDDLQVEEDIEKDAYRILIIKKR